MCTAETRRVLRGNDCDSAGHYVCAEFVLGRGFSLAVATGGYSECNSHPQVRRRYVRAPVGRRVLLFAEPLDLLVELALFAFSLRRFEGVHRRPVVVAQ